MRQRFDKKLRLSNANQVRLKQINSILEEYTAEGYVLTLRQLYYQLVTKNIIPNEKREYVRLCNILKKGRMAGIVDWDAIEDRIRKPRLPYWAHDPKDAMDDMIKQFRLDRMRDQNHRLEVWVEKDALSNVLWKVTQKYHVRLMVNRGYSSLSAMYDAYQRLSDVDTILYLGDHDPSGLDMVRDIEDRLHKFGLTCTVKPIAINMEQIKKFNAPPNPTKLQDPRAEWYIDQFGYTCWELDALPPKELLTLVERAIVDRTDMEKYHKVVALENVQRQELIDIKNNTKFS